MARGNHTGKGGFKDHPENISKSGQRNKAAVAFARTLRELIVKEGESSLKIDGKRHKKVELMIRQLWNKAIAGESWAVQFIAERVEGKVEDKVQHSGEILLKSYKVVSPDDWDDSTSST